MSEHSRIGGFGRFLASGLAVILAAGGTLHAAPAPIAGGTLEGVVRRQAAQSSTAIVGARVLAADVDTRSTHASVPTDDLGRFRIDGLPPGTYRLAVEADGGLYLAGGPVTVDAASPRRAIEIGLRAGEPAPGVSGGAVNFFDDPLTATLTVLGIAVVVGFLIGEVFGGDDDDGDSASPATLEDR